MMLDPYSKLESPLEICEAMVQVMTNLFADCEPQFDDDAAQFTFRLFSTITKGRTGDDELDLAIRVTWESFDTPQSEWTAVVKVAELAALAKTIFKSRDGPKTQILEANMLELLVRDDTPIPNFRGRRNQHPLATTYDPKRGVQFVIGRASMALVMKAAICRHGLSRFDELFDRERLISYLKSLETERATNSLPALRLIEELIHPEVLSLVAQSTQDEGVEKLEEWATAFRGRIAYEASLISPVSDINKFSYDISAQSVHLILSRRT
jgi:hypothetical protein